MGVGKGEHMRHSWIWLAGSVVAMTTWLGGEGYNRASAEISPSVSDGMVVTLEYTLALPDKTVLESNAGQKPVTYVHGKHEIIPGLEKALAGMKAGDKKHVTVAAEEAYGLYDDRKKVTVPKDKVPSEAKVGTRLRAQNGQEVKVLAIEQNSVVLDINHPLAGKTLVFDLHVLKVEQPPAATK
jgi:FKBP-type peptidyl-prolyl cis-trans isomerase 2